MIIIANVKLCRKFVLMAFVSLCLSSVFLLTRFNVSVEASSNVIRVPEDYPVIQWAIDAANSGDTILVDSGTYEERLYINKSISLIGEDKNNTVINALYTGDVITITADDVCVSGFTIKKGKYVGIEIEDCRRVSISNNIITKSDLFGISLDSSTTQISIFENNVIDNGPFGGAYGIDCDSKNNNIFRNNFINNGIHVSGSYLEENKWDNGAEGNYWDDYLGKDFNGDGIGDTLLPYSDIDKYPLMEPWSLHRTFSVPWNGETYDVVTRCNSTVASLNFSQSLMLISFNVTGQADTVGFCNVTIPMKLLNGNFTVYVDGSSADRVEVTHNNTHSFVYFTYNQTTHMVRIKGTTAIPEFPEALILPLFMIVMLLAVIVYTRKHLKISNAKKL